MDVEDIEDVDEGEEEPASSPPESPVSETPPPYDFTALIGSFFSNMTHPETFTPGGYPDDLFTDLTPEEKQEYQCGICLMVVRDPRVCSGGHLFCATCIFVWSISPNEGRLSCPVCRRPGRYRPNYRTVERVGRKRVKCPVEKCSWKGTLREYKGHKKEHADGDAGDENLPSVISPRALFPYYTYVNLEEMEPAEEYVPRAPVAPRTLGGRVAQTSRRRFEAMMDRFATQLELNQRSVNTHYREQERVRQEQLQEVERLGRRLNNVASNLNNLLDNMSRDSQRYQRYIQEQPVLPAINVDQRQSLPESLLAVTLHPRGHHRHHGSRVTTSLAETALPTRQLGNVRQRIRIEFPTEQRRPRWPSVNSNRSHCREEE